MPCSCAFGCKPTAGVAMHRFPSQEKFPERFKTWVTLCGGRLETSVDYYNYKEKRVCDRHFVENDHNRNKRLNALAVPSLHLAEKTSDIPEEIHFNEDLCVEMQPQEDAGQGNYVCGWVLTKCFKKICKSCQQCRQTLLNTANQKNKYIKAKEYCNKTWLCYPSEVAEKCFYSIQNITKSFLKKNVQKKDIKKSIIVLCDMLVEYPFDCLIHKEKELKACFLDFTINIILYSWCRNINRILSGKITYEGEEELKKNAAIYYNKRKHYKNKK